MKKLILFFLSAGLFASCTGDGATTDAQEAVAIKVKQDTVPQAVLDKTEDLKKQMGADNIKISPMDNPYLGKDHPVRTEAEKRELWNTSVTNQVGQAMETMVNEYKKGTFDDKLKKTASGVKYMILEEGNGDKPKPGNIVYVHFFTTLMDGTKVDANFRKDEPFTFKLGSGEVIKGWDDGVQLMDVNSNYLFFIPASLAYGKSGLPPTVPPNAELAIYVAMTGYQ